jgi:hypothetical protein
VAVRVPSTVECQSSTGTSATGPGRARPPAARMASTTGSILAGWRPLTATRARLTASSRQVAAPIPPEPPVATATLPARSG